MHFLYLLTVWLHILAAIVWIGGMAFLGAVLVPVLRQDEFEPTRTPMLYETALRFRWVGWVTLALLVVTGFLNVGPRTVKVLAETPDAPEAERLRRWSSWMGRLTLLLSLAILALAVALVRGGF